MKLQKAKRRCLERGEIALMHGKTVEDMQFDQGWKYMLEHVEEAEGGEEDA